MSYTSTVTTNAQDPETVQWIIDTLAESVDLNIVEALDGGLTLQNIVERSDRLHNSLDLMEAFAGLAHRLKRRTGVKVRLPNFPSDKRLCEVMDAFIEAYEAGLAAREHKQEALS